MKKESKILQMMANLIDEIGLSKTKTQYDARSGTATIIGVKDGIRYTTTLKADTPDRSDKSNAIGREAAIEQVKALYSQGFRQTDIADMIGVSQSTVSAYLKK